MKENEDYILFLTKWYPNYEDPQLGIFVKKHAELLAEKQQVKLIYICPIWKDKKPKVEHRFVGNLEEVIVYYRPMKGLLKLLNPYLYFRFQKEVFASFKGKAKFCFINIGAKSGLLAHYHLKKAGIPFSIIEHWSGFINGKFDQKSFLKRNFYKKLAKEAKTVFAVSEYLKQSMEKSLSIYGVQILPNVIETTILPKQLNQEDVIITVGDLVDEVKNISGIVRAFKRFSENHTHHKLWIVGGGESEEALIQLVKDLNLEDKVTFFGRLANTETLRLIQKGKFYVSNSRFETFGMTIAEALMAGLPVIATKSGGPDAFLNPSNSIQISINSDEELYMAMEKMEIMHSDFDSTQIAESIQYKFERNKIQEILESEFTS